MLGLEFYGGLLLLIIGLLYFYFVMTKRDHMPALALGTLLLLGFFLTLQGHGYWYPCGEVEEKECRLTGYEYWWMNYYEQYGDGNCCDCVDWNSTIQTLYCRELPAPFPGWDVPDYNTETNQWDLNSTSTLKNISAPNPGLTGLVWFAFPAFLLLLGYIFMRYSGILMQAISKKGNR